MGAAGERFDCGERRTIVPTKAGRAGWVVVEGRVGERLRERGGQAIPVISGPFSDAGGREAIVAAARFGAGRMVAFGHDGYLASALRDASTTALLANAANWAAKQAGSAQRGFLSTALRVNFRRTVLRQVGSGVGGRGINFMALHFPATHSPAKIPQRVENPG